MENLNKFEISILERVSDKYPAIKSHLPYLKVLNRKLTGVGMYVYFSYFNEPNNIENLSVYGSLISSNDEIMLPTLDYGLCHVLSISHEGKIKMLELVTYPDEIWDGNFSGYSFKNPARTGPARNECS